jgi:hypothetical protein
MTILEILADLDDRIKNVAEEAEESHSISMNSYGAGYDAGFVAALREINEMFDEIRQELAQT